MAFHRAPTALFASLLASACTGLIGDPGEAPSEIGRDDPPRTVAPGELLPAPPAMRRLTEAQYRNSLTALFGDGIGPTGELEADESTFPFSTMGAARVTTSSRGVEQYREAALEVAGQVLAARDRFEVLASCGPTSHSDPCIADVVRTFGRRLFRRPLSDEEVARYASIVGVSGDEPDMLALGMRYALASLLASPSFIYTVESGENDPSGHARYTSLEMASRLSFLLWNEAPDDELLTAAERGELATAEGVERHASRLLDDPRAKSLAARFLMESWNVAVLRETDKNMERFPEWSRELLADMRREVELFLEELTYERDGDLFEIFDGRTTFANDRLAAFYGLDASSSEPVQVALDDTRAGLLTSGAVIAANSPSDRSTPTERGVFILERVLCNDLPDPPPDALVRAQEELAMIEPGNERDFIVRRLSDPYCGGCHGTIDPLGMVFDDYDAIGRFREGGDQIGEIGGEPYASIAELATALRDDQRAKRCMTDRFYTYATAHVATDGEQVVVDETTATFDAMGRSFRELVLTVVTSDGFRLLTPAE